MVMVHMVHFKRGFSFAFNGFQPLIIVGIYIILCVTPISSMNKQTSYFYTNFSKTKTEYTVSPQNTNFTLLSSAIKVNSRYILCANYDTVYLLDTDMSLFFPLTIDNINAKVGDTFNPAGLFYDNDEADLFISNYKGNNILRASFHLESKTLEIVDEYKSPQSLGPENVLANSKQNILLSANYDAGTVTCFDLKTHKQKWSTPLPQAHGITLINKTVFATGLRDREVLALDIESGTILRKTGGKGWNPLNNEFLWPVTINKYNERELIICDAHTGYISFMNVDSLNVTRYTGGSGPTYMHLNYPYSATATQEEVIISSSFPARVTVVTQSRFKTTRAFVPTASDWEYLEHLYPKLINYPMYNASTRKSYVNKKAASVLFDGHMYKPYYGFLVLCQPADNKLLRISPNLFSSGTTKYFIEVASLGGRWSLIYSSSSNQALALYDAPAGKINWLFAVQIPFNCWPLYSKVAGPKEFLPLKDIRLQCKKEMGQLNQQRNTNGLLHRDSLKQTYLHAYINSIEYKKKLFLNYQKKQGFFEKKFADIFITKAGKNFLEQYLKWDSGTLSDTDLIKAAETYFSHARKANKRIITLDERCIIEMISNIPYKK